VRANADVSLRNALFTSGFDRGILAETTSAGPLNLTVDRTLIRGMPWGGIETLGSGALGATIRKSTIVKNGAGVVAGAGIVRLDGNVIGGNGGGISSSAPGTIVSRGNNTIEGNGTDGAPGGSYAGK
jgi:hypothetical protein